MVKYKGKITRRVPAIPPSIEVGLLRSSLKAGLATRPKMKAVGCYVDCCSEKMVGYLKSNGYDHRIIGRNPVEFLRSSSSLGKQCRVLLRDEECLEHFKEVVNTKKKFHAERMAILQLAPVDLPQNELENSMYMFSLPMEWTVFNERIDKEDYRLFFQELFGDVRTLTDEQFKESTSNLEKYLYFNSCWQTAEVWQSVRERAKYLEEGRYGEPGLTVEGFMKEVEVLRNLRF